MEFLNDKIIFTSRPLPPSPGAGWNSSVSRQTIWNAITIHNNNIIRALTTFRKKTRAICTDFDLFRAIGIRVDGQWRGHISRLNRHCLSRLFECPLHRRLSSLYRYWQLVWRGSILIVFGRFAIWIGRHSCNVRFLSFLTFTCIIICWWMLGRIGSHAE